MYDLLKPLEDQFPPKIFYDMNALELGPRLFPKSKHRSKRIHKKLVKRFGGEYEWTKPCIFRVGKSIFAHPAFKQAIEARSEVHIQRPEGRPMVLRALSPVHEGRGSEAERASNSDHPRWKGGDWTNGIIRILPDVNPGYHFWRVTT